MEYKGSDILTLLQEKAKNYNKFLINIVAHTKCKRDIIVDFGSGIGFFARKISQALASKIHCIEVSENLFSYYQNETNLILHQSLNEFEDNSVDLIYSFNVLEHIENDTDYIRLFNQKLKENGTLIIYVPAFMCLYSSMDKKVGHFRRYTKKDLIEKLEQHFKIEKCCYADSAGFVTTLLYKIFGDKNGDINPKALVIFDRFLFPLGRIFDILTFGKLFGKNVLCIARKKTD